LEIFVRFHYPLTANFAHPRAEYSLMEIHAFIVELINGFEFALAVPREKIRREPCTLIMIPAIAGEVEKGAQLPLLIKVATPMD
jgi:hypothetical protein